MPTLGALETVVPTERESQLAEESSRELSSYLRNTEEQTIRLPEGGRSEEGVTIPAAAFRLPVNALT